jgi:hypothetical protein
MQMALGVVFSQKNESNEMTQGMNEFDSAQFICCSSAHS